MEAEVWIPGPNGGCVIRPSVYDVVRQVHEYCPELEIVYSNRDNLNRYVNPGFYKLFKNYADGRCEFLWTLKNDDGTPASLDGRVIEQIKAADMHRRGAASWEDHVRAREYAERKKDEYWQDAVEQSAKDVERALHLSHLRCSPRVSMHVSARERKAIRNQLVVVGGARARETTST